MAHYPSYKVTVTRPIPQREGTGSGGHLHQHVQFRTVARNVACEIFTATPPSSGAPRKVFSSDYAQAHISPMVDVRDGDHLTDPLGHTWEIEILSRNGTECRCALRAVVER